MAISVQMPALGESVTEGTVTRWLKQEGDTVEVDELILKKWPMHRDAPVVQNEIADIAITVHGGD